MYIHTFLPDLDVLISETASQLAFQVLTHSEVAVCFCVCRLFLLFWKLCVSLPTRDD